MKISADKVVSIDYTLKDDDGDVVDSSEGQQPLQYLHGHGQIVPGLERELEGRENGDAFQVKVPPAQGYGDHDPEKVIHVPRSDLPADLDPQPGMRLVAEGPNDEQVPLWIVEVSAGDVTMDANHPLAGQTLHFDIQIRDVRDATDEEKTHGHAHEPGGGHGHSHE